MAHKKALLNKYLTDPEETDSSCTTKSPIHDGKTWIIPETSNSDNEISKEKNGRNESDNCQSVQQVMATTSSILHPHIVESSGKLTNIIFLNLQFLNLKL